MATCHSCGFENQEIFAYCVKCGATLVPKRPEPPPLTTKICPKCNSIVASHFRFCGSCGFAFLSPDRLETADFVSRSHSQASQGTLSAQLFALDQETEALRRDGVSLVAQDSDVNNLTNAGLGVVSEISESELATFTVIQNDGSEGASFSITENETLLGRHSSFRPLREDSCISPEHLKLEKEPDGFNLIDCDSRNGVFVGIGTVPVEITHGDQIRFGRHVVEFRVIDTGPLLPNEDDTITIGSKDHGYWGLLSVISRPNQDCLVLPLHKEVTVVGRHAADVVIPSDYYISGMHFEIRRTQNRYVLRDLDSSNGTYLRIRKSLKITTEATIMMGQQLFLLRF